MSGWRRVDKTLLSALATDDRLTRSDLRTLLLALRHETEPGAPVKLSVRFVASGISLSKRSAQSSLSRLQTYGYLIPFGFKDQALCYSIAAPTYEADAYTQGEAGGEAGAYTPTKQTRTVGVKQARTNRRPRKTSTKTTSESDVDELLDAFAKQIKPGAGGAEARDRSGSRKVFKQTARKLLEKHALPDLIQAARNYAASESETEPRFRKGFQSFFGPKLELYRDFLPGAYKPADPAEKPHSPEAVARFEAMEEALARGEMPE